jgi:predicted transposase YdaD
MTRPFDVTTKHLFERRPADWLAYAGLGDGPASVINTDLATVSASADHVLRVEEPEPWLAHFEFQSGRDPALPRRVQLYNVLLNHRLDLSVQSVVLLLRPQADGPELTGLLRQELPGGRIYHEFHHRIIRLWEQPVGVILAGGIGTLPLAPLSDVPAAELPSVIHRLDERFRREVPPADAAVFWAATYILMGLRYDDAFIQGLLMGVGNMTESTTYQAILRAGRAEGLAEGRAEGRFMGQVEEGRRVLITLGGKRFGPPSPQVAEAIAAEGDLERINGMVDRLLEASNWEELLAGR